MSTWRMVRTGSSRGAGGSVTVAPEEPVPDRPPRDEGEGLDDDPARHLRRSSCPIDERDRHFDHTPAPADEAIRHLDLEPVALGADAREVDRLEGRGPVGAKAGGGVVDGEPEGTGGIAIPPPREHDPVPGPVRDAAPGDVAGADGEVGAVLDDGKQRGEVAWVVGQVTVHLHEHFGTLRHDDGETLAVGGTQAALARAPQHPSVADL